MLLTSRLVLYPKFPWVSWSWFLGSRRRSFIDSPRGERQMLLLSVKGMVDNWVVGGVEYEEMIDGNDEADPCLICLGSRPHQVTCHQDRTDLCFSSLSSSSQPSGEPCDIVTPSSYHWCSSPRHSFIISLLVTIMLFLSLRHPDPGSYTWYVVSSNIPRNERALGRSFPTSEFLRPRRC